MSEKLQTRNYRTANDYNFIEHFNVKNAQTSHTEGFEITAAPPVGILLSASPLLHSLSSCKMIAPFFSVPGSV